MVRPSATVRPSILRVVARLLLVAAAGSLVPGPLAAPPAKGAAPRTGAAPAEGRLLPFPIVERTLPNGLTVIVVPTGFPDLVSLQIPVQVGSRNEIEPGKSGFAHFFEHMMFRGTEAWPPDRYQAVMNAAGARQNAYTTDDFTNYHVTFAKSHLEKVLELEADRFQRLKYSEADFRTEAQAILGEYNKNSSSPTTKLFEVQREQAFKVHTYRHTTMGFLKDIEQMPEQYAYSRQFFDRWYRPEHTTLIVAGDVEPASVLKLVEKHWGGWKRGTHTATLPVEPPPQGPVVGSVPWTSPTLPWVSLAFHGPAFSETAKDHAALQLLFELQFGPTSEIYRQLVEREQKVDQLFAFVPQNADPGLATITARVKKPADVPAVRDALLAAVARARAVEQPPARVADAVSRTRYGLLRRFDNTDTIAATLARFVRLRRSADSLENYYRLYTTLTPADLRQAARTYLTDARLSQTTLATTVLPEAVATLPSIATLEAAALAPGVADVPFVVQKTGLPQLTVKFRFAVGSKDDPPGKEGLAVLAARMLADAGSRTQPFEEVKARLYPIAADLVPFADKEVTTFTANVHRDNWARFAEAALPLLLEPGFREDDFRRLRDAQLNALRQDLKGANDEELGRELLASRLYAGTPYGHPVLGTVAGIEALTLDDVKAFVAEHFTRARLVVGVAGDAGDELAADLRRRLAALPAGKPAAPVAAPVGTMPQGIEVELVSKETRAVAISLGFPLAVTRSHPDFAALSVARSWLGEHRSSLSHLYQRIREVRGMNYGDYAYIEPFPAAGSAFNPPTGVPRRAHLFEIWIRPVSPYHAPMALRIAIHELRGLVERGLTEEQFRETRDYLVNNLAVATATQEARLGYALDQRFHGAPEDPAAQRAALAALTRDDVNRAIRTHLQGDNLKVVMVAQEIRPLRERLLSDAPATITYEVQKPKELLAEDREIGAIRLRIDPTRFAIVPLDEVFAR